MKKLAILSLSIFSIIGLSGCITPIDKDFQFKKSSTQGIIVATVTLDDKCGRVDTFKTFAHQNSTLLGTGAEFFAKTSMARKNDPDLLKRQTGYYYMTKLDAGKYNISGVTMWNPAQMSSNAKLFTFTVKPRTVTYIGEVAFMVAPDCSHFKSKVVDDWKNTKHIYATRLDHFPAKDVVKALAKPIR